MFRTPSLRTHLLLLQVGIVFLVISVTGVVAAYLQADSIRDAHQARMVGVAESVARLPSVIEAFAEENPAATIDPIAELIRQASDVTYVVVTDAEGIRYSHPNPERIGEKVSTDPSVPLSGETFVGTEQGTLGTSWRVKVPVWSNGDVIGTASVGVLESELTADLLERLPILVGWLIAAAVVGSIGAFSISRLVWRRIHRQEPEQIAELLQSREALLHGVGEGLLATDRLGNITLANDEAKRLLGIREDVLGLPAAEALEQPIAQLLLERPADERLVLAGERILLAKVSGATVGGSSVGAMLVLRDRTELHAVLRDLSGARDMTQALRAQAHEFSNRLHVISGLLELGQAQAASAFIGSIDTSGSPTGASALASVTDPELGALLLAKGAICREKGIELVIDSDSVLAPSEPSLGRDLITILGNLIDNAIEAVVHQGRIELLVCEEADSSVLIEIHDDGPGIDPAMRDSLWELGTSTKAGNNHDGARGIGLALVHRVVTRRRGTISVAASDLGGAAFTVLLPPPAITPANATKQAAGRS
ncbi:ATP-binding protein [Paeniglutamicibacter psychrophenolicus]|uniref:ATP-binding protein n=1 Tax=Paeniglutamicibacter psychrophenolicus TaxID=257454 RepID=UPI00277E31BE|nr:sensor histidine kinase [Paeniglutamicibacter psychrophenolicus]MDQ0094806.1 two-component system CitB family sensor kinase [Paeniglutamicibacter psychrophenolicus]